jgi:hypothetical protein
MLTVFMGTGLMSCAALEAVFGEGTVFTTADQVVEGGEAAVIPFDQLPDSIKEQFPEGTTLVMTSKDALVDGASFIPAGGDLDEGGWNGIFQTALGIGTAFLPGLAAWEGVLTLFSQRKRQHYVKAAKSIIPTDKNIDIGGMLGSITAALGASHSSDGTAALHAEEEAENVI